MGSTLLSAAVSWGGNIKAGAAGKINNVGEKGWLSCRGWTPRRQEQAGRIISKVNSILDNTSQLSALWGGGRLKTPVRCYTECFRLFFVSQPLHCSMLHVQMAPVQAYWEGNDRNTGLNWSAVASLISISTFCQTIHIICTWGGLHDSLTIPCSWKILILWKKSHCVSILLLPWSFTTWTSC